jgi:radical SAM protein with 4Fe4S-binding SPASM domain
MIVKRLPYIIFREYPEHGYLTDNRNFGYDTFSKSCKKVGDLILSKEASIFYSLLTEEPKNIDIIVKQLREKYSDIAEETLYQDAIDFYSDLASKGFVYFEKSGQANICLPEYFSYSNTLEYKLELKKETKFKSFSQFSGTEYSLTRVHLDISSRCNENCVHCYIPERDKRGLMSEEIFDDILKQCVNMHVINITISGGEPMLNPNLNNFLRRCKQYNFSVNLLSNLTLLTNELLETIVSNPLISIQTSLYAMDERVHDSITRNEGSFRKTIRAIKMLHDKNIPMQINCPIMKQNRNSYQEVLKFAESLNIESSADFGLFGSYDCSFSNLSCRLDIDQIHEIVQSEYKLKSLKSEVQNKAERKKIHSNDYICSICKSSICISNTGEIYPCEGLQGISLGNISEQSLNEIWEFGQMTNKLRDLTFHDFMLCDLCENKEFCTPCLVLNANESKKRDFMKVNPLICKITSIKKKEYELHH